MSIQYITSYFNKNTGEIINPSNLQNIDPNVVTRLVETITEDPINKNTIINATTITPNTQTVTGTVNIGNFPSSQTVHIDNFPSILSSGSFNVANFPNIQPVSGSISVANFPSLQTVLVSNFPTTQPISGSVAISNFPSTQTITGSVAVSNFPSNQNITITGLVSKVLNGAISIDNFPTTQAVSLSVLPLPTGAAQDGVDTTGITLSAGSGIRGWLSGIYKLLSNTINVNVSNQVSSGGSGGTITGTVSVSNFPITQPVSGSVSIANFPTNQQINGNVSILNLPNIQQVSGSVNVGNLPTIQPVSGSISVANFPSLQNVHIDAFPTNQVVSGSVSVSNFPSTQVVSGSVNIGNFPVTQPVSLASQPLPTGAAQDGVDITGATLATGSGIRGWLSTISVKLADKINVSVLNFPSTQTINGAVTVTSGAVNVGNFPTTQAVSGTVAISNLPTTQAISGSVNVSNLPSTQIVSGNVNVSGGVNITNFPTTQAVSIATLPLPALAAQDGVDTTGVTLSTGSGIRGWLSGIYKQLNNTISVNISNFPSTQTVNGSVSLLAGSATIGAVTGSGNFTVIGFSAIGAAPGNNPISISGVDGAGLKQHLRTDTFGAPNDVAWISGNGSLISLLKANIAATNNLIAIEQPDQGVVAMTVGTVYTAGRKLRVKCTTAGDIILNYVNGTSDTVPINTGLTYFTAAVISVTLPGSNAASATYANVI